MAIYYAKYSNGSTDPNTGGTLGNPWLFESSIDRNGAGSRLVNGDIVYCLEDDYIIPDGNEGFRCTVRGTEMDLVAAIETSNIQSIMDNCIHWMAAPNNKVRVIKEGLSGPGTDPTGIKIGTTDNTLDGVGCLFWNMEIFSRNWIRDFNNPAHQSGKIPSGIKAYAPKSGFINCLVHNTAINMGPNKTGSGTIFYGILSSQAGWDDSDRKHGHNFYQQNREINDPMLFMHCIAQFACAVNFHVYAQGKDNINGQTVHLSSQLHQIENVAFDAGAIPGEFTQNSKGQLNYLLGGYQKKEFNKFNGNMAYSSGLNGGAGILLGYVDQANIEVLIDSEVKNNYLHAGGPIAWTNIAVRNIVTGNTTINQGGSTALSYSYSQGWVLSDNTWANNTYYTTNAGSSSLFRLKLFTSATQNTAPFVNHTLASWRAETTFDLDSTAITGLPTSNQIFYHDNKFRDFCTSNIRGMVTIYNWQELDTVDINPNTMLSNGDTYKIIDSQFFDGAPIAQGTYTGSNISINMNLTNITPTIGDLIDPVHTDKRFVCLQVFRTSTTGNTPPTFDDITDPAAIPNNFGQQTVNISSINDVDGDTITMSVSTNRPDLISGLTINHVHPSATATINYTPIPGINGTAIVTVTANDGTASTIKSFNVTTLPLAIPTAPSGFAMTPVSDKKLNTSWTDNSTGETAFEIRIGTATGLDDVGVITVGADQTSKEITDADTAVAIQASTTYFASVRALNPQGTSAYSNEDSATTLSTPQLDIDGFTILSLTTDPDYEESIPLQNGGTYNLGKDFANAYTVEVTTLPYPIEGGSVIIEHVETGTVFTENNFPYNLGYKDVNDPNSTFPGFVNGTNTLRATAYSEQNGGGTAGPTTEIVFTIENKVDFLLEVPNFAIKQNDQIINHRFSVVKYPNHLGLTVTASSSDQILVPDNNIEITGTGKDRFISITPSFDKVGTSIITLTLTDLIDTVIKTFSVSVEYGTSPTDGTAYFTNVGTKLLM